MIKEIFYASVLKVSSCMEVLPKNLLVELNKLQEKIAHVSNVPL